MTVEELLWGPSGALAPHHPEPDPLVDADALQEAQLLDMRVHAATSVGGLLFELRTALQLREGNAAVLVVEAVREVSWSSRPSGTMARSVVGSRPNFDTEGFSLDLDLAPSSQLRLAGGSAAFHIIEIPNIGEAPPDYTTENNWTIRRREAAWQSSFSSIKSSRIKPI